jgi:hypothetical protein
MRTGYRRAGGAERQGRVDLGLDPDHRVEHHRLAVGLDGGLSGVERELSGRDRVGPWDYPPGQTGSPGVQSIKRVDLSFPPIVIAF